jgi:hypothetical protein
MLRVQKRNGHFRSFFGGGTRYGDAAMGYGLLQTGLRDHDRRMAHAGLRAITYGVRRSGLHANASVFEDMAVASAYNLARPALRRDPKWRRDKPVWAAFLRTRHLMCLEVPGYYANHCLVNAVTVLELDRSGLRSQDPLAIVGPGRAAARQAAVALVNERLPAMAAAGSVEVGSAPAFVLSDPPDEPLAYQGLSVGMYAHAIDLLGAQAAPAARRTLAAVALASWALAGPDGDVGYFGRSQEEAWALSGTALGAAAAERLPGTGPGRAAKLHALADRVLGRLHAYGFGHFGLFNAPVVRKNAQAAPAGLDHNAGGPSFSGVALIMLDWALPDLRRQPGPPSFIRADRDGAVALSSGTGRFAVVRHGDVWFAVRMTHSDQRSNDLRYDLGLVTLKVRSGRRWRPVAPIRPITQGQPDSAGPNLVLPDGARLRPQGGTLTARPDGRVTIAGGWEAGAPADGGGLLLRFSPVACGVRVRLVNPPPAAGIEYSGFFAHRLRWQGGTVTDGTQRIMARPEPSVSVQRGYASADDAHLVRAQLQFRAGTPHDDLTICSAR